jgi:hypothetical protein
MEVSISWGIKRCHFQKHSEGKHIYYEANAIYNAMNIVRVVKRDYRPRKQQLKSEKHNTINSKLKK